MAVDPYPIPKNPVTQVSDQAEVAKSGVAFHKPVWVVPQAFGWYQYNSDILAVFFQNFVAATPLWVAENASQPKKRKNSRPSRRGSYWFSFVERVKGPRSHMMGQDLCEALVAVLANGSSLDAASGSLPQIVMMQSADQWHLNHVPTLW